MSQCGGWTVREPCRDTEGCGASDGRGFDCGLGSGMLLLLLLLVLFFVTVKALVTPAARIRSWTIARMLVFPSFFGNGVDVALYACISMFAAMSGPARC